MKAQNIHIKNHFSLNCKGRLLSLNQPVVMGILNTTPDSFFDGGKYTNIQSALKRAEIIINDGGKIIDIGGYSSRPGAALVSVDEELRRTVPVIEAIVKQIPDAIISIDTFRAKVANEAIAAGASMINDISAGDDDPQMIETASMHDVPFVAMHKKGKPQNMQHNPQYDDVTVEILDYFIKKKKQLKEAGLTDIIIDPGFGFGKTTAHNFELLNNISAFKMLECPIMVGVSRKKLIYESLKTSKEESLNGTTVLNTFSLLNGADLLRVHDVKQAVEAVNLIVNCNLI
ncbi:MAG: dihydropteroate synthase [Bacteroidetes bacterium]|nr:dihydropteroate synthase [Bacteroidota bacterium]